MTEQEITMTTTVSLIDAVGYARRSSDGQDEASIPDQIAHVQQYAAAKGYRILRWYTETVSGDDTENRTEFLRMRADASAFGDFKTVLCWDQARFGRFDILDAGYWIYPFRRAGVRLVTVCDGPIDWDSLGGQVIYSVNQAGKNQFLKDHSHNVLRGQLEALKKGSWVGRAPYAYRVEGPKKAKKLVLGEPAHVRVVQRIYREYVAEGRSLSEIAARLNAEGYAALNGAVGGWSFETVKHVLENPAYCGDFAGNRFSRSKYSHVEGGSDGRVVKGGSKKPHPEAEWIIRRDNHEALVDRETWEKAAALLAGGKTGRKPEDYPYVFRGLLRCGLCGCPLGGVRSGQARFYECTNRAYHGADACAGTTVKEAELLVSVADFLESWLAEHDGAGTAATYGALDGSPGDLPPAFAAVKNLLFPRAPARAGARARLEKLRVKLTADLTKARCNLVLLDAANIPAAQERIRQMDEERAAVEQALQECKPVAEEEINRTVLGILDSLVALAACCRTLSKPVAVNAAGQRGAVNGDGTVTIDWYSVHAPQAVQQLRPRLAAAGGHMVIHTTRRGWGKGLRHTFVGGEIVFAGTEGGEGVSPRKVKLSTSRVKRKIDALAPR
jgi:DNA invertase Pin-like site-specific DNA recombinase